jgi:hypothetical protein
MRILVCAIALLTSIGCGSSPEAAPKTDAPPAPRIRDNSSMLPINNRTGTHVVQDHILDIAKLPGGTIGDYKAGGKEFQLFIVDCADNQAAAFLLLDAKAALQNPEYISYMGGYFGTDGKRPLFVFSKLHYLAGVAGLPKDEADPIARVLASKL